MRRLHLLIVFSLGVTICSASFDIGVKFPIQLGLNIAGTQGVWFGLVYGGGVAADIKFADVAEPGVGIEVYGAYRGDMYSLPSDHFTSGAYLTQMKIAYGVYLKLWLAKELYLGIGPMFTYTFGGQSGDALVARGFTAPLLGTEIYASATAGYSIPLSDDLFVPIECHVNYNGTIPNAIPFELGLNIGFMFRLAK